MPTLAGQMSQTPPGNPQWRACNGSYAYGFNLYKPVYAARPHAGVSTGTVRDYVRNVGGFSGTRGIGGWMLRAPYDAAGTWFITTADDSGETTIPAAPTPQKPPAGVK